MNPLELPESAGSFLRMVLDAMPAAVFVVDDDVQVLEANAAGRELLRGGLAVEALPRRAGELLHCLHAAETPEGCGRAPACRTCVVRAAVGAAVTGRRSLRRRCRMTVSRDDVPHEAFFLISASPLRHAGRDLGLLVLEDISEFMELRRIVPICAKCKKVRNDGQYWQSVEHFMARHLDVDFSHSYCPDCLQDALDELDNVRLSGTG